jgi:hypothetical protein
MAVGNNKTGKKFKANLFPIRDMNLNEETQTIFQLSTNSVIKLKYKLSNHTGAINKQSSTESVSSSATISSASSNRVGDNKSQNGATISTRGSNPLSFIEEINKRIESKIDPIKRTSLKDEKDKNNITPKGSIISTSTIQNDNLKGFEVSNRVKFYEEKSTKGPDSKRGSKTYEDIIDQSNKVNKPFESVSPENRLNMTMHTIESSANNNSKATITLVKQKTDLFNRVEHYKINPNKTTFDINPDSLDITSSNPPQKKVVNPNFRRKKISYMNEELLNISPQKLPLKKLDNTIDTISLISKDKITFMDYVVKDETKEDLEFDSFCEAFFICSFPYEKGNIIEDSEHFFATCGHQDCSMLPAFKAEILARYPMKDNKKLELNNLAATLCFPSGVKVCYNPDESNKRTVKNYSTSITNQDGTRYYMMTYHYYSRIQNTEYIKLYQSHPLKEFMKFDLDKADKVEKQDKKKKQKVEKELEICENFGYSDFVYVPFCACLISKYPYTRQMEKCIETIIKLSSDEQRKDKNDVYKLILHLTRSIPIPPMNKRLKFFIPFSQSPLELIGPVYKDLSIINNNLINLLELFSIENILIIYRLMLFEQKLLFVDDEYNELSEVIDSFICLLYPIQ